MKSINPTLLLVLASFGGFVLALLMVAMSRWMGKRDRVADIEYLQYERDHREQMQRSKGILFAKTKRAVFSCLFLLGVAVLATFFIRAVYELPSVKSVLPQTMVIGEKDSGDQVRVDPYNVDEDGNIISSQAKYKSATQAKNNITTQAKNNSITQAKNNSITQAKNNVTPRLDRGVYNNPYIHFLPLVLWLIYTLYAYLYYRKFSNVNSHMKALNKIDDELVKLQKKMEGK